MLSCASEPGLNNPAVRLGTHTSVGPPEVHCPWVASVLVALFLVISHLHNYGSRLPGVLCLNGPRSLLSILGPQPCGWPGQREENWGHWLGVEAPSEGFLLPRVLWPKCMADSYEQATIPNKEAQCVSGGSPEQPMGLLSSGGSYKKKAIWLELREWVGGELSLRGGGRTDMASSA